MADYITTSYTNITEYPNTFKRQGAFPLEMYSVFTTTTEANEYLTHPLAYEGQIVAVREDNTIKVYVITVDTAGEELAFVYKEVGSMPEVDGSTIKINDNGQLEVIFPEDVDTNTTYKIFGEEVENGYKIILTSSNEADVIQEVIVPDLDIEAILADYYTKEATDSAIATAVANAAHLKREIVDNLDDIESPDINTIYMVLEAGASLLDDDQYAEYMYINNKWERLGAWTVDLSSYAKTADIEATYETKETVAALDSRVEANESAISALQTEVGKKVDAVEGSRLITTEEVEKLEGIEAGAQVNYIKSVDMASFAVSDAGNLTLNSLDIEDITNLQTELDKKVNTVYYTVTTENEDGETVTSQVAGTLLSPDDKEKLEALVIGEGGSVEISGTVNASNVQGLDTWVTDNRDTIAGLLPTANQEKLEGLANIKSVNTAEFEITSVGQLNLAQVPAAKVEGLVDLQTKVGSLETTTIELVTKVGNLETELSKYVLTTTFEKKVEEIENRLTWQEMSE